MYKLMYEAFGNDRFTEKVEGEILADLIIDKRYYNTLDIEGFSKMMNSPSYCYKFYWLEAIVQLISANKTEATYDEIINKMISNAWYPVLEFHIHLSGIYGEGIIKDNLEKAVLRLQEISNLANNASDVEIINKLHEASDDKELSDYKKELTKNVPYKSLSGFANRGTERIDLDSSAGRMMAYYNRLSQTEILLPYTFNDDKGLNRVITFSHSWIQMIQDNTVSILGWIQLEKVKWLQNNNPEVPGLVYKLAPADEKMRKLSNARRLWDAVLEIAPIMDVFKEELINAEKYDLDHFIPWSFVMNDELWNLMPMDSSWNSKKSNKLPKWDGFFNRFAGNQFVLYELLFKKPGIHKLYEACYRDNLHSIWANQELYRKGNSKEEFRVILEKNMRPVYDSARRQGYEIWNLV
ncbi:HNH endonuclease domain-containing protein [Roseburia hominis]|uniref:HNH endonuclease domain-containing protein n=1 Tax=Roseburia hominis TaxID=301301 RepID=UPI0022E5FB33|nr:HNH endonuclease domain-containing protein [Roseburia hominis]